MDAGRSPSLRLVEVTRTPRRTSSSTRTPRFCARVSPERPSVPFLLWFFIVTDSQRDTGYFPRKGSVGVRHQDGGRCVPKEGWTDPSWLACLWQREGGTSRRLSLVAKSDDFGMYRRSERPSRTPPSSTFPHPPPPTLSSRLLRTRLA